MAGHTTKHPYLKTYDELTRSVNRMKTYLDIYWDAISDEEKESIQIIIEKLEVSIRQIPGKYHVSRWNQFNK